MSYIDTYKSEFRFSAQGRTTRRDFWIYTIGTWLITLAVSLVAGLIYGATGSETLLMGLIIIGCIGLFVLNIAYIFVTIRRLHDMGYSGWWYLAVLGALLVASFFDKVAPLISLIVLVIIYVCLSKGSDVVPNRYD